MNCFNCGEEVPEGQNFCGNCGAPQSADPGTAPVKPTAAEGERSGSRTWLWLLLGCGGLIVISCCLGFGLLFALSGVVSESAVEVLEQMATVEPDLLDETFSQMATLIPDEPAILQDEPSLIPATETQCELLGISTEPWLPVEIKCEKIPAETGTGFMDTPAHARIGFENYPISPAFHEPQIMLYPVASYREINQEAADRIDQLKGVLANRPEQPARPFPFLPVWNAGQSLAVKLEYLDFVDGEGIRYLAQYGQAAWPINNQDLFYTFQGLTADGEYYISVVLPVTHPDLPPDGDSYIGDDFEAFIGTYESYLDDVEWQLEQTGSKVFVPNLSALDAVMRTISVR
jgi:hypothetical protein